MRRETLWPAAALASVLALAGCGTVGSNNTDSGRSDGGAGGDAPVPQPDTGTDVPPAADARDAAADAPVADAGTDRGPVTCAFTTAFGAATQVTDLDSASHEDGFSLGPNGLTVYFSSNRAGGAGAFDLYSATRSAAGRFTDIMVLGGPVNSATDERVPWISADGLRIYYMANSAAAPGFQHVQIATRNNLAAVFSAGQALAGINSTASDNDPTLTPDESAIYFTSSRAGGLGGYDLYTAARGAGGAFGAPTALTGINSNVDDARPVISPDQLTLYFGSSRAGTGARGEMDIWMAHRSTMADGFGTPQNLTSLNGAGTDFPLMISTDGCTLYFGTTSMGSGGYDIYVAQRTP